VYLGTKEVLSGFTLTNGYAYDGGGVWCASTNTVVTNCVIIGNSAEGPGGAFRGTLSDCTVSDNVSAVGDGGGTFGSMLNHCTLTGNSAINGGGAATSYRGWVTLNDCTLSGNSARDEGGGAVWASLNNCVVVDNVSSEGGGVSRCTLNNCVVSRNQVVPWRYPGLGGGALWSTLNRCTVTDNRAAEGGGGAFESLLNNCTIDNNSPGSDGAFYSCTVNNNQGGISGIADNCLVTGNRGASEGTFYNCTVVGNESGITGTAFNSILYYNSGGNYAGRTTLNYCCTSPRPINGVGNITGPPSFTDMPAGDFRLSGASPCIDAGTNLVGLPMEGWKFVNDLEDWGWGVVGHVTVPSDILGNTRLIDGNGDGVVGWDIGAYEFDPETTQLVDIPDVGLLAAIRTALGKPAGDITVADMRSLTVLDASREVRGPDAPLIQSLEGLQAARYLTELNLNGEGADAPNIAVIDFSPLTGLARLSALHLAANQLTSLTLPEGLTGLRDLDVRGNPVTYLAVHESMDLTQLVLEGFPKDQVTIIMLRIGPASVGADGKITIPLSGTNGQSVRVQRSANLVDWEDWQTVTLDGTAQELVDGPASIPLRFYRVTVDTTSPGN